MDFTREPIIETVITPKEGCKLVIRSSKSVGQEEYFVDAVQVVSFGASIFFRSLERPKAFLVPASDYEILEVREARIVLKHVGAERSIKIGGGREGSMRSGKEATEEAVPETTPPEAEVPGVKPDVRAERRRDRRRQYRRRRGREDVTSEEGSLSEKKEEGDIQIDLSPPQELVNPASEREKMEVEAITNTILSDLLTPPPSLISETIAKYKDNALFKGVFISKEEEGLEEIPTKEAPVNLEHTDFGSFETSDEDEEEIYRQRKRHFSYMEESKKEPMGPVVPPSSEDFHTNSQITEENSK